MIKKKLLIPLITAACFMYGCSSSSAVSAVPAAETETAAAAEDETAETKTSKEDTESADKADNPETSDNSEETASSGNTDNPDNSESTDTADETEESTEESTEEESLSELEDVHIETAKNACPENFPQCTYGKAFEEFFTSPEWKYFESTDGRDVVEFTGDCMYEGARTKVRLQLITDMKNSTVTPGAMSYNNTPQNIKVINASLENIFKQYADKHGISYPATQPLAPEESSAADLSAAPTTGSQTDSPTDLTIQQGGRETALSFAAWDNPGKMSWYSPSTGYYLIPFIDSTGNASLAFTTTLTEGTPVSASVSEYYTDVVSAVLNEAGGLTYQGYLYRAGETPQMIGIMEAVWTSEASISGLSVNMINGSQTIDTSVASNDYTYSGTAE